MVWQESRAAGPVPARRAGAGLLGEATVDEEAGPRPKTTSAVEQPRERPSHCQVSERQAWPQPYG